MQAPATRQISVTFLYNTGMKRIPFLARLAAMLAMLTLSIPTLSAQADAAPAAPPPPDFELIDSAPGVDLYRKDYAGGTPDYVLVVDLSKSAGIHLLPGTMADAGSGGGAYGGNNPTFTRQSLQQFWDSFTVDEPDAFCLVNGSFFATDADPAALAFPLKVDGQVLSEGYGQDEFPDQKRMLELWPDHARITTLSGETLAASDAPAILAGLTEDANKDSSALIGRTFAGVEDADENGSLETVLFISSKTSRAADAAGVLRSFGADDVIMLDGGDSAQMMCDNQPQVYSDRSIPQAVGISAGEQAAYSMKVARQTDWAVAVKGKTLEIELTLTNTGSEPWRMGEVALLNQRNDWGAGEQVDLPQEVPPGESITLSWITLPFEKAGVFVSQWQLARGTQVFSDRPVLINIIVIPPELEDKKAELEAKIREWARQQVDDMEQMIMDWIQAQVRRGIEQICPFGAALPGAVIAGEVWKARRKKRGQRNTRFE